MEKLHLKLRSMGKSENKIAALYEHYPYPPIGYWSAFFQRVRWEERPTLNYRAAYAASFGSTEGAAARARILVAGCGTFEPIVVALANPTAEILAVDLSAESLKRLRWQARVRGLTGRIQTWQGDLEEIPHSFGKFDFVIATGVLHHLPDPARGLKALVGRSAEHAVFRFMAYSYWGRALLYETISFAAKLGVGIHSFRGLMESLPPDHPYRIYFHLYSDARSDAGLADGYFHPCDRPFKAFELRDLLASAGLEVSAFLHGPEGQPATSESPLRDLLPASSTWERLALLELYGELQENFRLFACRSGLSRSLPQPGLAGVSGPDFEWNEALPARGRLYSHILDKKILFNTNTSIAILSSSSKGELQTALYLLPRSCS